MNAQYNKKKIRKERIRSKGKQQRERKNVLRKLTNNKTILLKINTKEKLGLFFVFSSLWHFFFSFLRFFAYTLFVSLCCRGICWHLLFVKSKNWPVLKEKSRKKFYLVFERG